MTNSYLKHMLSLAAAASTTLVLFSAVASLADSDKAALSAARTAQMTLASRAADSVRQ